MIRAAIMTGRFALVAASLAAAGAPGPCGSSPGGAMDSDSVQVTHTTDKSSYRSGEPIQLRLRLVNRSAHELTLDFGSAQRFDVRIEDQSGATRWQWSADQMFAQMMGQERVPPGGSLEYPVRFEGRLAAGSYTITGSIASGSDLKASARIAVR